MRFEEAYSGWGERRFLTCGQASFVVTQVQAAELLGVCTRTFRRYIHRYESEGLEGLLDKRMSQISHRRAPVDEVLRMVDRYRRRHEGWSVKHYYAWYRRDGGTRSYNWVRTHLQAAGAVEKSPRKGAHRKRRERAPWPGMMLHQDGSSHEWVQGQEWDLIVTMDDATSEHYSMFLCEEESTMSSFVGVRDVIESRSLFCSLYTDRASHYWNTPEAGGKVDKAHLTQFRRAMQQLGVKMIPAYSPEARGRSERAFRTHQGRLPKELAALSITTMAEANRYIEEVYRPAFNEEFMQPSKDDGSAFVVLRDPGMLDDMLCQEYERVVRCDNCVRFDGLTLQIPADRYRCHYIKAKVKLRRHMDGTLTISHGPRRLARYAENGEELKDEWRAAA